MIKSGRLSDYEWEQLVKCPSKRRKKDKSCGTCDSCIIRKHHHAVVTDLRIRKHRTEAYAEWLFGRELV